MTEDIRLNSSKLGTQEYWDNFYRREIENFEQNSEDTGECWFDDSDAESKMISFIIETLESNVLDVSDNINIIDLGTGNGHLLFQLYEDLQEESELANNINFKGIDYSPESVAFSEEISRSKNLTNKISFEQVDLLNKNSVFINSNKGKYDILLDKGTLDAIALNQDPLNEFDGKIGMDVYSAQISQLMHKNSILLLTSCNFTEEELIKIITQDETNGLSAWRKVNYPSFQFGGIKGTTICTIAFIRNV